MDIALVIKPSIHKEANEEIYETEFFNLSFHFRFVLTLAFLCAFIIYSLRNPPTNFGLAAGAFVLCLILVIVVNKFVHKISKRDYKSIQVTVSPK